MPDEMELEIVLEHGSGRSTIRVMKLSDYGVDAVFEKRLYLLIPFLLFNYEKRFQQIEGSESEQETLKETFRDMFRKIDELTGNGDDGTSYMDVFTNKALRAMTHTVVNHLAEKYPKIREGVNQVVGGKIINFEALEIKKAGIREGRQAGLREGRQVGLQEGEANTFYTVAERLIQNGSDGRTIAAATGYDRSRIDAIARQLNRTVAWNGAGA